MLQCDKVFSIVETNPLLTISVQLFIAFAHKNKFIYSFKIHIDFRFFVLELQCIRYLFMYSNGFCSSTFSEIAQQRHFQSDSLLNEIILYNPLSPRLCCLNAPLCSIYVLLVMLRFNVIKCYELAR